MSDRNPVLCIPKHLTIDIADGRHWRLVKWEIVPVTVSMAEQLELVELTTRDTDSEVDRLREAMNAANACLDNGCQGRAGEILRDALLEDSNG